MSITPTATRNTLPSRTAKRRAGDLRGAILYLIIYIAARQTERANPRMVIVRPSAGAMSKKTTQSAADNGLLDLKYLNY